MVTLCAFTFFYECYEETGYNTISYLFNMYTRNVMDQKEINIKIFVFTLCGMEHITNYVLHIALFRSI